MHDDNAITAPTRETQQYFYHSDHLGSSSLIADVDGNVAQHIEYIPYGEVFVEERNNSWSTPYEFNGKELDEETGLYYYGARYYDPRTSLWVSVDPLAEKYVGRSSYEYCMSNPTRLIDPTGMGSEESGKPVNVNDIVKNFNTNDKGSSYFLTLYVKQPGKGGDRDPYEINNKGADVGHTFVKLTQKNKDGSQIESTVGFYPTIPVDPAKPSTDGVFKNDEGHEYTLSITYKVAPE